MRPVLGGRLGAGLGRTLGVGLVVFFWLVSGAAFAVCQPDRVDLRQGATSVRFTVELAETAAEQRQGLMFRDRLPRFAGMLFLYESPRPVSFWMKNTLIPLDILFLDESGVVQRIAAETTPLSTEAIPGGEAIQAVLEINGGLAERLGLEVGAELRHPSLPQDRAAWPCAA